MRRNNSVDLGWNPKPYRSGLGSRIVDATDAASNLAEDYMQSAKDVNPFGQDNASWRAMRANWYSYINGQKSASTEINSAIAKDIQNPANTDWSNTALGQWIAKTTTPVWTNMGWWPSDSKEAAVQAQGMSLLGNLMALYAYKQRNAPAFNAAYQQLSSKPSRMPANYLVNLGIPPDYGVQTCEVGNDGYAKPTVAYTSVATPEQKAEAPNNLVKPVSAYYKIDDFTTSARVRKSPNLSADIVKTVDGPLSALVTTNTEGWFAVNLSDGTSGWISSKLLKEISKPEFDKLVASEKGTTVPAKTPATQYMPPAYTPPAYTPPAYTPPVYAPPAKDVTPAYTVPTTEPTEKEKDNTMLYVGIGAGVLSLLGVIFYINTRPQKGE